MKYYYTNVVGETIEISYDEAIAYFRMGYSVCQYDGRKVSDFVGA